MKRLGALALLICLFPPPAFAQSVGTTGGTPISAVGSSIDPTMPLPPPKCPATATYSFCDSLEAQIQVYNHYASLLNDLKRMDREAQQYMRYPQAVQGYFKADLEKIGTIVQAGQGLNFLDKNVDQQVQSMWPDWRPGYSLTDLDNYLEQRLQQSVSTVLKVNQEQTNQATRDSDIVEQIKTAAAHSTSPTQTGQMTVQLLSVIFQAMRRQEQAIGLKSSQEAAYDLLQIGEHRTQRQMSEAAARQQMRSMYPVAPTLTKAKVQEILDSRAPTSH